MKIIVVGCGKIGRTIAEQLNNENHEVIIIDNDRDIVEQVSSEIDVMSMVGNGATYNVLKQAGVAKADLVIAVTPEDEVNMLCCLIAKKIGAKHTIARIRNPEYAEEIDYIKDELGLSMYLNPERATANEIAKLLRFPSAIEVDTFAKGRIEILNIELKEGSHLTNSTISESFKKLKSHVLVCAVRRGDETFIPDGSFELKLGDKVSILASSYNMDEFFHNAHIQDTRIKNAMIVGGGMIAFYLAEMLVKAGITTKIIERDEERCEELSTMLGNSVEVICGDGTDKLVLEEEGLSSEGAFVALTNIDEENIMLSLYAKTVSKAKAITKIDHMAFTNIVDKLNIGVKIYPKEIAAEYIISYVRAKQNSYNKIEALYRIAEGGAEAFEFRVPANSRMIGPTLAELKLKKNVLVCSINRYGNIYTPKGSDTIQEGDIIIIVTTLSGLSALDDFLEDE